jgi:hypothetical protein
MKKLILLTVLLATPATAQQVTKLPAQDRVLPGKPAVQFSIGAEDGEDWELLSRVTQAAFDKEENLYVLDSGNHRVLVFSPQGKFIRKIGKRGGGPGELMSPVGIAVTSAGEIAVTDLGRPAVSLFRKDGTFIKNLALGEDFGFPVPTQGTYAHPAGGVVVRTMPPIMRRGGPEEIAPRTMTGRKSPLTWFTTDSKTTKLFEIPQPDITPKVNDTGGQGQRQVAVRIQLPAFTPTTMWGVLPNGTVAIGNDINYKLEIARNGKVERVIERPFSARKVTEADKNRERARRREQMQSGRGNMVFSRAEQRGSGPSRATTSVGGSVPKEEIEQMLRELTFAEYIPVLTGMYVDPRGRMWVQRAGREVGQDGPIDLINANGTYVGTIAGQKLPAAVSLSGRAAYVERDDMDVEKVVVRKLPAGW